MTELRREGSAVRYYCTAGNGMEAFLNDEVKTKLAAEDVCQIAGKVLFSSSAKIDRVRNLKAAERLFLLLIQDSPLRLSAYSSPAKAASVVQARLLRDKNQWTSAVMTWSRLQGELESSKTAVKKSSSALGVTRKEKEKKKGRGNGEQRDEGEKCLEESRISTGEQREEEIGFGRQRCSEQNGVHTMEKKRRRDDDEEEGKDKERNVAAQDPGIEKTVEAERMREEGMLMELSTCRKKCRHGADFSGRGSGCDHTASRLEDHGESHSRRMDDISKDFTREVKTTGERNKMLLTTSKDKTEMPSCVPVSFRISCKCTGSLSRCLNAQEVSRVIGVGLNRLLGWKADLKNPQLEINVHLSDDYCLLGIPLTRLPLATRSYMKITGLRSTVAWAMASLADIQPGFCVVDPMCGVGTILIEAAQEYEDACFLGVDIDDEQLQKASENIAFAELRKRIHLLKASSLVLPLPSASVDAVICDLPFGRKFSSRVDMAANLPLILTEMERVLRTDGTLVLLLSPQLSCLLKKLLMQKDTRPTSNPETKPRNCPLLSQETEPQHSLPLTLSSLMHQATFRVSLGAIDGLIHKYVKTDC